MKDARGLHIYVGVNLKLYVTYSTYYTHRNSLCMHYNDTDSSKIKVHSLGATMSASLDYNLISYHKYAFPFIFNESYKFSFTSTTITTPQL